MARNSGGAMARQSQQVLRSASSSSQPSFQFFPNPGFVNPYRTISVAHSISFQCFHLQTLLQFPPPLPKPSLSATPTPLLALRYSIFMLLLIEFLVPLILLSIIKSEDEFSTAVSRAKDGAVPTLFFFTAVWCGPCRFISPIIRELSEQYPHVTTYKVDINEKGLTNTLDELNISSVPTFQFFKDGKKVTEVVGTNDVAHLRDTFRKRFK